MIPERFRRGLWASPDFVRLWAGTTVSQFGTFIGGLALQFAAVLTLDATPLQIAVLAGCQLVPGFLIGPVAGVWVDRLQRRPILIVADIGRAAILLSVPIAAVLDVLTIGQLWVVAVVMSSLSVFFDAAYRSYLPSLVGRQQLIEGNSKLAASSSVAEIGGFGLSGWLVQVATAPGAVLIDAFSFAWSALWIWRIKGSENRERSSRHHDANAWREFKAGIGFVARQPILRALAGVTLITGVGGQIISVTFLLYLADEIGFKPGILGLTFAVGGVTSLAGAFVANRSWFGGLGPSMVVSLLFRSLGSLFLPLVNGVNAVSTGYLVAAQLTDPAWLYYEINEVTLRQSVTPDEFQGRMNATMRGLEFAAMMVGTAVGGLLGEFVGLREALFVATGTIALGAVYLALTPVGRLKRTPPVIEA